MGGGTIENGADGSGARWSPSSEPRTLARDLVRCELCRHRGGAGFESPSASETAFLTGFKLGRDVAPAGAVIGRADEHLLFTVYSGWIGRYRRIGEQGYRWTGIALPGDLVGLESLGEPAGAVRLVALTDASFCRFDSARWAELMAIPSLADKVCRAETHARRRAEQALVAATSLSAAGRFCHFVATLYDRLRHRGLVPEDSFRCPLTRLQIAAALGLSPMHLRRILSGLEGDAVMRFAAGRIEIADLAALRRLGSAEVEPEPPQPLI